MQLLLFLYIISIQLIFGAMSSDGEFSVLTYNLWDLFVAHMPKERMKAVIREISSPNEDGSIRLHDVMAFQEMWSPSTYDLFKNSLSPTFPYSHYFQGSAMGSGLAIFSRHPIIKVKFHRYSLNGNPIKVFDGDWFVGKGVGQVRIEHPVQGIYDIFTTHLIADYSNDPSLMSLSTEVRRRPDEYLAHRVSQAYELMQFVESNIDPKGNGAILMGDLNIEISSLPWQAFIDGNTLMSSIFDDLPPRNIPCTCNCPLNGYRKKGSKESTIDHILYTPQTLELKEFRLAFTGAVSLNIEENILLYGHATSPRSYSDHFGLSAVFRPKLRNQEEQISKTTINGKQKMHSLNAVKRARKVIKDEEMIVARRRDWAKHCWIMLLITALTIVIVNFLIVAVPSAQPNILSYGLLLLLPLTLMLIIPFLILHLINYPNELALLKQLYQEMEYFNS